MTSDSILATWGSVSGRVIQVAIYRLLSTHNSVATVEQEALVFRWPGSVFVHQCDRNLTSGNGSVLERGQPKALPEP